MRLNISVNQLINSNQGTRWLIIFHTINLGNSVVTPYLPGSVESKGNRFIYIMGKTSGLGVWRY